MVKHIIFKIFIKADLMGKLLTTHPLSHVGCANDREYLHFCLYHQYKPNLFSLSLPTWHGLSWIWTSIYLQMKPPWHHIPIIQYSLIIIFLHSNICFLLDVWESCGFRKDDICLPYTLNSLLSNLDAKFPQIDCLLNF